MYFRRYIAHWLKYTPYFFTHAPHRKWHTYFASAHRIASGMAWYDMEWENAETLSELEELDNSVFDALVERAQELQFKQMAS